MIRLPSQTGCGGTLGFPCGFPWHSTEGNTNCWSFPDHPRCATKPPDLCLCGPLCSDVLTHGFAWISSVTFRLILRFIAAPKPYLSSQVGCFRLPPYPCSVITVHHIGPEHHLFSFCCPHVGPLLKERGRVSSFTAPSGSVLSRPSVRKLLPLPGHALCAWPGDCTWLGMEPKPPSAPQARKACRSRGLTGSCSVEEAKFLAICQLEDIAWGEEMWLSTYDSVRTWAERVRFLDLITVLSVTLQGDPPAETKGSMSRCNVKIPVSKWSSWHCGCIDLKFSICHPPKLALQSPNNSKRCPSFRSYTRVKGGEEQQWKWGGRQREGCDLKAFPVQIGK